VVMIAAMLVLGCAPKAAPSGGEEPTKPAEPIKIGYIGNMAWAVAIDASYAPLLAADEINESGGILGRDVEILIEDSKGEAPLAVAAY